MNPESSRREFVTASLAAATVGLFTEPAPARAEPPAAAARDVTAGPRLHIEPRYHRWHVDPGVDWVETNTGCATLDWRIPVAQAAIVLVDVWSGHYLKDTEARAEVIITEKLVPLLTACRAAGLQIIHAPSSGMARRHPNWVRLVDEPRTGTSQADWPPAAFRDKTGDYQSYRLPKEPREEERAQIRAGLTFHPKVQPLSGEPVVANGEELHRYCRQAGILFLLFAGFNTNACILHRDYGTLAMSQRGYEVILVRDCTTGMESRETQPTLSQTHGAVLLLEMFGCYSVTSDEIIAGLPRGRS